MERFTSRKPAGPQKTAAAPAQTQVQETFSEMANVTANRSGIVGKLLVISLIIVSIAITAFVGYAIVSGVSGNNSVKNDQYQAVFLTDGQIYFGKLSGLDREYAVLEDIYYLQVDQQVQPDRSGAAQPQISLAKLGSELHGPEDEMFINPDQILFWENLKADGQVTQAITNYVNNGGETQQPTVQEQTPAPADNTGDNNQGADNETPAN